MDRPTSIPQQHSRWANRKATATVELALCLPAMVILVFGSIEVAHFIHLKQDLSICAYEAGKVATRRGNAQADVTKRFQEIAAAKGVKNASLSVTPAITSQMPAGTEITLTASAPASANYDLPISYFSNRILNASVVVVRQQY